MKTIGIIGIRGYDVIYSGFETFVKKLVNQVGNQYYYFLYCRKNYQKKATKTTNFETVNIPTITHKYFETTLYSFISDLVSVAKKCDTIMYLGLSNTLFIFVQKLFKRKTIVNVDGLDWQRKRWNLFGKLYLKVCERITFLFADVIVCDSQTVLYYYQNKYHSNKLVYIPYGIETRMRKSSKVLEKYHLVPKKYIHTVGRLTPENCIEDLIIAFKQIKTDYKCVIVGDSVYEDRYKDYLLKIAKDDNRIIFTGFLQGQEYEELCTNSSLYIETKEVGGTHPSLLEAIAFKNPVIAKNINFHKEVLEEYASYYDQDLVKQIKEFMQNKARYSERAHKAKKNISKIFSWKRVIRQYEELFS